MRCTLFLYIRCNTSTSAIQRVFTSVKFQGFRGPCKQTRRRRPKRLRLGIFFPPKVDLSEGARGQNVKKRETGEVLRGNVSPSFVLHCHGKRFRVCWDVTGKGTFVSSPTVRLHRAPPIRLQGGSSCRPLHALLSHRGLTST